MHNGYFKTLKQVVHFYNTATDFCQIGVPDPTPNTTPCKTHCEALGLVDATAEEAISNYCWPKDEFGPRVEDPDGTPVPGIVGNLNLTASQEDQLVEYMRALDDGFKP